MNEVEKSDHPVSIIESLKSAKKYAEGRVIQLQGEDIETIFSKHTSTRSDKSA